MANNNSGGVGVAWGFSASTGAIIAGALAIGGLAWFMSTQNNHNKYQKRRARMDGFSSAGGAAMHKDHMKFAGEAAAKISPVGVEDEMFDTILANADRPSTVVDNEDRVRESIRKMFPHAKELVGNYINGALTYEELIRELRASTIQVHKDLDIPVRYGTMEDHFPPMENHPRRHGHRIHAGARMMSPLAKHFDDGDDNDDKPNGLMWPWIHESLEPKKFHYGDLDLMPIDDAPRNAYPGYARAIFPPGFDNRPAGADVPPGWANRTPPVPPGATPFNPPGQNLGWLNPNNPHFVGPTPPAAATSPLGWERGRYNPHDLTADANDPYGFSRRHPHLSGGV